MSLDAIITGVTPLQAMKLVRIVYDADYLHVPGVPHRRSRGYDHATHSQHQAPLVDFSGSQPSELNQLAHDLQFRLTVTTHRGR